MKWLKEIVQWKKKKALVDNIKAARDGSIPEYFDAVKNIEKIAKPLNEPKELKIQIKSGDSSNKGNNNRGDLLRAAKEMCMAMKDVNALIK